MAGSYSHTPFATQNQKERMRVKNMKIQSTAKLQVIAKGEPTKSMDGKSTYYKITVLQGAEAGQLSVSEELYRLLNIGESVMLILEYNDAYKSLRVVSIDYAAMSASQSHPATTPPPAPAPDAPASGDTPAPAPDAPAKNGRKS